MSTKQKKQSKQKKGLIGGIIGTIIIPILLWIVKPDIFKSILDYMAHKDGIQLKNDEACRVEVNDYYSEYVNTHQQLRDDINYIQDMYSKWLENNRTLPTEAEEKLKNIFSRLYFILKSDEGDTLKQNMERWLKVLVPSIKSDEEEYKKLKEQMTQETTENSGYSRTPLTPALPDLTDAMEAYDTSFKTFINDEVQNCVNRKK